MFTVLSYIVHQERRDQLYVCSKSELYIVARLCARVDIMFVYVMQIRQKSSCPIH